MHYLVATHSRLLSLKFDENWQITEMAIIGDGHHYGIALVPGNPPRIVTKHNTSDLAVYRLENNRFIQEQDFIHRDNDQIHQIAYGRNGIYIANTYYNSVTYQSFDGKTRHEYSFYGHRTDINHVNSVFPCDDLVLVLLHNRTNKSEIFILHHDLDRGFRPKEVIRLAHIGCHNIFVDKKHLYYCASGDGRFIVVDRQKRRIIKDLHFIGHTKGLSVTDDVIVFGVSDHAEREARLTSRGRLVVLDRRRFAIITMVDLNGQGNVGNVNEIRCLSAPELAHAGAREVIAGLRSFAVGRGGGLWPRLARLWLELENRRRQRRVMRAGVAEGG
ncbi:MAG: hypothetical protein N2383_01810 [Caldilineales bacterium]|nr:hypothetical protein [Caldilineales bacterium]